MLHFKQPPLLRRKTYNKRIQVSAISMQMSSKHFKITFRMTARPTKSFTEHKVPMLKISVTDYVPRTL